MVDFIKGSMDFFREYFFQILLASLILSLWMVYLTTHDIHIKDVKPHLVKKVTVEAFESPFYDSQNKTAKAFDEMCKKDPYECNNMCGTLKDVETCNTSNSCVWVHDKDGNQKCVTGNHLGATFNPMSYAKTLFQNKEINI